MKKFTNIIVLILVIVHAISFLSAIPQYLGSVQLIIVDILGVLVDLFIIYYVLVAYKKPHGNALRYLFFSMGFIFIIQAVASNTEALLASLLAISGIIAVYMSGRLNKIEKNKALGILGIGFSLLWFVFFNIEFLTMDAFMSIKVLRMILIILGPLIQWLALCIAYQSRFKAHKEAGLLDK